MKNIYLLITVFILSLSITACTSSTDDNNDSPVVKAPDKNTTENNTTTKIEDNNTTENNETKNVDEKKDPILNSCSEEDSILNGDCVNENIVCSTGFELIAEGLTSSCNKIECTENQTLIGDKCENFATCQIGEVLNKTSNQCEVDKLVKALANGTVRDGLIFGATITSCKVVDKNKTEANTTCSKTDSNGNFKCAVYETDYEYLIFKAIGGTDLGENKDSRDDRANLDTLRTVVKKIDIENNTSSFISPATNLVVLKAFQNEWNIDSAITTIQTALNTNSVMKNDENGIKSATVVANILDSIGSDKNRSAVFITLSKETTIYTETNGVEKGIITKLDDRFTPETEAILNTQIQKSINNPSDINEKVIDELSSRIENNQTVSEVIAKNFVNVLDNNYLTENKVLNLVSEIPTEKNSAELKTTTDKISEILKGVADSVKATAILKEKLMKDSDISNLTVNAVKVEIGETVCGKDQKLVDNICKDIVIDTKPVEITPKDAVGSPSDIPAIPNNQAKTFQEASFPTMPKEKGYLVVQDDNLTKLSSPADQTFPKTGMKSADDNQTTPNSNK